MVAHMVKILIVDDDDDVRLLLHELVKDFFAKSTQLFECHAADNSVSAQELLKRNDYHLIFMDVRFPGGKDGVALTAEIREKEVVAGSHRAKIICITGMKTEEEGQRALAAGADKCFFKPFDINKITEELTSTFGE